MRRLLSRWWPALAWAILISVFSTALFTSDNTGGIIIPILHWLLPRASPGTLFTLHHVIRKCAHFTEYFVLSLLILRAIRAGRPEIRLQWVFVTIAMVAAYASLDEIHQIFVPGRGPAVHDVLLDTAGGIAAQAVAALRIVLAKKRPRAGLERALDAKASSESS